tara:strand:+ start:1850 stop:2053 length:204 start_codon:yes stop_codon:yes gene_type:complete
MKNLNTTLQSVIRSFNNQESISFTDLQIIDERFEGTKIADEFIDNFNKRESLNFLLVQKLDSLINHK